MDTQEQDKTYTYEGYLLEHFYGEGDPMEAFGVYLDNFHKKYSELTADEWGWHFSDFEEAYIGEMTVKEYAEQLAEDNYPEAVKCKYFDYDAYANDLERAGEVWETDGHLFRSY